MQQPVPRAAVEHARLLEGVPAKVNLIQYNENPGLGYQTTVDNRAERFRDLLDRAGVAAVIRANRGRDIAAACGQLANTENDRTFTPLGKRGAKTPLGDESATPDP